MSEPTSPVDAQTSMKCFCHIWYLLNNVADKIHPDYDHDFSHWDIHDDGDANFFMSLFSDKGFHGDTLTMERVAERLQELYPDEFNVSVQPRPEPIVLR